MVVSSAYNVKCNCLEMYVMSFMYNEKIDGPRMYPLRHTTDNFLIVRFAVNQVFK